MEEVPIIITSLSRIYTFSYHETKKGCIVMKMIRIGKYEIERQMKCFVYGKCPRFMSMS